MPKVLASKKKTVPRRLVRLVFILLFISAAAFVWSFYNLRVTANKMNRIAEGALQNGQNTENPQALLDKISRLILLPQNERPSIATINNVAQLQKNWPFYENARNGDVLLIYFQAKKAYIYDPEKNMIINMGSVDVMAAPVLSASSTTSTP